MEVRSADPKDGAAMGRVARRSLQASHALSPEVIDEIVAEYGADAVADRLDDGEVYLVAETEGEVVGFARGRLAEDGVGELVWLHVAPGGRGDGAGTALFERLRERLRDRDADGVRALVLADNQEGDEFLERFGLRKLAEADVERAGVSLTADVYAADEAAVVDASMTRVDVGDAAEPTVDVPESTIAEDRRVYVDGDDPIPGSEAPFLRTYTDESREEHFGYLCTNCGSTATAMGELERIECADCGNVHRADEWDAAYL